MRFEVAKSWGEPGKGRWPVVVLRENNWDDFGFKTLFGAEIHLDEVTSITLGGVKIIRRDQTGGATEMPGRQFQAFDRNYCSLGQEAEYYEKLATVPEPTRTRYLRAVRDAAFDQAIRREFMSTEAWSTSLTRFGQASHALEVGKDLAQGIRRTPGVANFN